MRVATLLRSGVIVPHGSTRRAALALAACLVAAGAARASAQSKPPLVVAVGADTVALDPHKVSGGNDYLFFANVFEGLYAHDEEGNLVPALAESAKASADGLTYDVALRPTAKFHDGSPVTSEDVRYSWQRAISPQIRNPRASILVANIAEIETPDPRHVRIKLKKRDAAFLENSAEFWYIVPKKYTESVGAEAFAKKPIGTGPFQFVEHRTKEFIKLRGFEQHWGRVPKVSDLTIKIVPDDQTRIAQVQTGEADIVANVPPFLAARFEKMPKLTIIRAPSYQNIFITLHATANPILAKKEVRRALNMAIDKDALMQTAMLRYGSRQEAPCTIGITGCDAKVAPYGFDPKKAREMLQKAGFDFNKPLKFVGLAPGRTPQSKEIVEGVAYFLKQIGVNSEISTLEYGAWLAMYGAKEKDKSVDLFFTTFTDYNSDSFARLTRSVGTGGVFSWFSNPTLDAMISNMNDTSSADDRAATARKVFQAVHEEAPFITLWSADSLYAVSKNIRWKPTRAVSWPVLWNVEKNK